MHDAVQDPSFLFVVEDDAAQRIPVQRAVRLEDLVLSKVLDQSAERVRSGGDRVAGEDVEVDERDVVSLEQLGDCRLSAGDATGQADDYISSVSSPGPGAQRDSLSMSGLLTVEAADQRQRFSAQPYPGFSMSRSRFALRSPTVVDAWTRLDHVLSPCHAMRTTMRPRKAAVYLRSKWPDALWKREDHMKASERSNSVFFSLQSWVGRACRKMMMACEQASARPH